MRKLFVAGIAIVACLAVAAVAFGVTNTYTVQGSTVPKAKGTKKKPIPIGINFAYSVGTVENQRPDPVKKYSILFGGTQVNNAVAPKCSTATLEDKGPSGCPAGSIVGSGYIENATGARDNPNDQSIVCNARLWVINGASSKGNLYVKGSPNATDTREKCAIELAAPIPFNFVRQGGGTAMEFTVPESLLHPLPTLSNAVKRVSSKVPRKTKRIKGKKRGYFEAIGGCTNGTRKITVTFTPENGPSQSAQAKASC